MVLGYLWRNWLHGYFDRNDIFNYLDAANIILMINEIFDKHGTDKGSIKHNYGPFYEKWLPKNPRKILEIGVLEGASLRAWREIFPNAEIHGLDLFSEWPEGVTYFGEEIFEPGWEGFKLWRGSQLDEFILHELRKENFDVIIDDGSHNSRDQLVTFFSLFAAGCYYFIEDLQCCNEDFYRRGLPRSLTAARLFQSDPIWWVSKYLIPVGELNEPCLLFITDNELSE